MEVNLIIGIMVHVLIGMFIAGFIFATVDNRNLDSKHYFLSVFLVSFLWPFVVVYSLGEWFRRDF